MSHCDVLSQQTRRLIVKSAQAWCVAIGLLAGTNLLPAALAQDSQSSNQQSGQDNAKLQEQVHGQALDQNRDPHAAVRQWYPQGVGREVFQWNQHIPTNNPQARWLYARGPNAGGLFAGSGTTQDLDLAAPDAALREHLNLPKGQGIVVMSVDPHSSAAQAGLQQSDILLMLGDHPLGKPEDLFDRLKEVGEKPVSLTLLRAGSRKTIQVQPLIRISLKPVAAAAGIALREYYIGIGVTALGPVLRAQLGLQQPHAVIVNQLVPDSPAAKAGIALHDIILSVDGKLILDPNDIARIVQAKGGKSITLEVIGKGGKPRTVSVTPGRRKDAQVSQAPPGSQQGAGITYDVVRPGAVLEGYYAGSYSLDQPYQLDGYTTFFPVQPYSPGGNSNLQVDNTGANHKPQTAGPDWTKRLDTLDSDLKELRKLVEELQKAATRIIERQNSENATTSKQ
jgi:hypothetical protein